MIKQVTFGMAFCAIALVGFGQKTPKAGAFKKFLKTNRGVSFYVHYPNEGVIVEDDIKSWDWENYTIVLEKKAWKKLRGLKFEGFEKKAENPTKSELAFSLCINGKEISPILVIKDTIPFDIKFPYVMADELKANPGILKIYPSKGNFDEKMKECREIQDAIIDLGQSDSYERLVVMELFRQGKQMCSNVLIPHMMLYDRDLFLYLEFKKLLKESTKTSKAKKQEPAKVIKKAPKVNGSITKRKRR